jgi:hypothetical protein
MDGDASVHTIKKHATEIAAVLIGLQLERRSATPRMFEAAARTPDLLVKDVISDSR